MVSKLGLRGILSLAALLMGASWASAATIQVPAAGTDLQVVVDNADPGDTIEITDSGTYEVTTGTMLVIRKPITIIAAEGESPTITNEGDMATSRTGASAGLAAAATLIRLEAGASGTQIGTSTGGRINLIVNQINRGGIDAPTASSYIITADIDAHDYRLENVYISQEHGSDFAVSRPIMIVREDHANTTRTVTLHTVEYDASTTATGGINHAMRVRVGGDNVDYNIIACHFHGWEEASNAFGIQAGIGANFHFVSSIIETPGQMAFYVFPSENDVNHTAENSLFIGGRDDRAIWLRPVGSTSGASLTMNDSVVVSHNNRAFQSTINGTNLTFNRVDFINNGGSNDLPVLQDTTGSDKSLFLVNSNIVGVETGSAKSSTLLNVTASAGSSIGIGHSNVWGPDFAALTTTDVDDNSNLLHNLDPDYGTTETLVMGDVSYTNTFLKTAGNDGGPVGNDRSLAGVVPVELSTFSLQ